MKLYSHVIEKMEKQGGSFAKAIALAYRHADAENAERIESAFSYLFKKYDR